LGTFSELSGVNGPGHRYQGDPLQGIREFVKIAGIQNLEDCLKEMKKEGYRLWKYLVRTTKNEKS